MGRNLLDTYEKWERQGVLKKKLKDIEELVGKNITQKRIAECLGITEKTLIKLKKKHRKLDMAFVYGNDKLKEQLESAMLKKALGYTIPLQSKTLEDSKPTRGKKNKIVVNDKHYPPDYNSIRYLLIIKFGRDYNEKKDEIDAMYKRIENKEEEWFNEDSNKNNKPANKLC